MSQFRQDGWLARARLPRYVRAALAIAGPDRTQSTTTEKEGTMLTTLGILQKQIYERADALGYPLKDGLAGAENWRGLVERASRDQLEVLSRFLDPLEAEARRRAESDQKFDAEREAREQPMDESEIASFNQLAIEAEVAAQDALQPATRAQLDELIRLQRAVLAALARR